MSDGIPYHPSLSKARKCAFQQYLAQCPGLWTLNQSFVHREDPRVLCLRWIVPGARWCDIPGYLDFLDNRVHRRLLRCFFHQSSQLLWTIASLCEHLSCEPEEVEQMITFCALQGFIRPLGNYWCPDVVMEGIENIGSTFEWMVHECLQRFCGAIARRCVVLQELQGDLDVLAFMEDGLVVTVECKSGTSIPRKDINNFLERATLFPANIALMLIDTDEDEPLTCRLAAITSLLGVSLEHPKRIQEKSLIYHIAENIYLANTAGGIQSTLKSVLAIGREHIHSDIL